MKQNNPQEKQSILGSIFSSLKIIYPPFALALVLFPLLVGMFINIELVDFRQIVIFLVWIPVFTLPFLFSRKKIFYYAITILCFINGFTSLGSWILIKHPGSASSMFVMFNTTFEEAVGFSSLKSNYGYLLVIPYLILLFLALRYPPKIRFAVNKLHYIMGTVMVLFIISFITENTMNNRFIRLGTPVLYKSVYSFNQEVKLFRQLKEKLNLQTQQLESTPLSSDKPQVTVLILGESTNRNHMSVYNKDYIRETSPFLSKHKDLIVYTDVISGYCHTMESVPNSLSESNLENGLKPGGKTVTMAELYRSAGYKTYWLSNQSPLGVWDNIITLFAQQYNDVNFVNGTGSSSVETLQNRSYDSKLFEPLITSLAQKDSKKFIVLHLIGTHSTYSKRYPKDFERFTNFSTKKDRTISEYDNSVLYNDYVVDSLFKIVQDYCLKNDAIGNAIYISDHSENVYDVGDDAGHDYAGKMPGVLVEIPFIVWLSPEYNKVLPQKSESIYKHRTLPFVTDDLFHALIDISGIKAPIFIPQRSVFNDQFNRQRKRILVDGYDYDEQ